MRPAAAGNVPVAPGSGTTLALEVEALTVALVGRHGQVPVVTGAGLALARREILGVVGESGSGKSMTSLAIMRLLDARSARIVEGSVRLFGRDLLSLSEREMRSVRGSEIGMIFQDPMTSLDPAFTDRVPDRLCAATPHRPRAFRRATAGPGAARPSRHRRSSAGASMRTRTS